MRARKHAGGRASRSVCGVRGWCMAWSTEEGVDCDELVPEESSKEGEEGNALSFVPHMGICR